MTCQPIGYSETVGPSVVRTAVVGKPYSCVVSPKG